MNKFFQRVRSAFVADGRFSPAMAAVLLSIVIAVNGIVYALTAYFGLYIYSPAGDIPEITDSAESHFARLAQEDRKVEILFCMAEDTLAVHDTGSFVYNTAKQLAEKYPEVISLEYMNILTRVDSKGNRRTEEIEEYKAWLDKENKKQNLDDTNKMILRDTSVVFTYTTAANRKYYRVLTDNTGVGFASFYILDSQGSAVAYNGEEMLTAMSILSTENAAKKVYFTQYHGEIVDVSLASLLTCAGYEIHIINLRDQEVPEDCDLLMISAPQTDFEKAASADVRTEIERLSTYVKNGGHLLVTTHSYLKNPLKNLDEFLKKHGIETVKSEGDVGIVKDPVSSIPTDAYTLVADYAESPLYTKIADRLADRGGVALTQTAALSLSGKAKPLLLSSSSAILEADGETVDRSGSYTLAAMTEVDGGGDIVVIPSVYLTASDAMTSNTYSNRIFVYGLVETLYDESAPLPYGCFVVNLSMDMLENLTARAAHIYTAIIFLIPAALTVAGFVILRRRRNR